MILTIILASILFSVDAADRPSVIVVVGAPGTDEYAAAFRSWSQQWEAAAQRADAEFTVIGLDDEQTGDREVLRQRLSERMVESSEPLWLVLIGHGTFDGRVAKFNLRGPDVSAEELAEWLKPAARPLAIINCASASGPFINLLTGPNRVVVTATRSGAEHNYARFGHYLSAAIADPNADLDKDQQTSLLEAFLLAAAQVAEFYEDDARLATEHALLDDNGDGLGTQADWFQGVRAARSAKDGAPVDGRRANQLHLVRSDLEQQLPADVRLRRDELELQIEQLRDLKTKLAADEYYRRLEVVAVELAKLYHDPQSP